MSESVGERSSSASTRARDGFAAMLPTIRGQNRGPKGIEWSSAFDRQVAFEGWGITCGCPRKDFPPGNGSHVSDRNTRQHGGPKRRQVLRPTGRLWHAPKISKTFAKSADFFWMTAANRTGHCQKNFLHFPPCGRFSDDPALRILVERRTRRVASEASAQRSQVAMAAGRTSSINALTSCIRVHYGNG